MKQTLLNSIDEKIEQQKILKVMAAELPKHDGKKITKRLTNALGDNFRLRNLAYMTYLDYKNSTTKIEVSILLSYDDKLEYKNIPSEQINNYYKLLTESISELEKSVLSLDHIDGQFYLLKQFIEGLDDLPYQIKTLMSEKHNLTFKNYYRS